MVGSTIVVELVKKSILQCFCRSCHVSAIEKPHQYRMPKAGVRTTQPKLLYLATEVRATEEAKGGLKYELVLAEPAAVTPPRQIVSPQKNINLSLDEINRKMKEAEERRLSMEATKLSKISSKFEHLQEVSQKRESFENQFKEAAREGLVSKMESNKENREKHLNSIKEKMKDHNKRSRHQAELVRRRNDSLNQEKINDLHRKLEMAAEARKAQIAAIQERHRLHERHVVEVRMKKEGTAESPEEAVSSSG